MLLVRSENQGPRYTLEVVKQQEDNDEKALRLVNLGKISALAMAAASKGYMQSQGPPSLALQAVMARYAYNLITITTHQIFRTAP